jgi:cytochrome oxidase Cu insertion factor (SCO1/SenC/PrrC family)
MCTKIIVTLAALFGSAFAAEIPRKAPDFPVQLMDGKQMKVSDYRGKVLCLVFILTT